MEAVVRGLADTSAAGLARMIRARQTSAYDVLTACLERVHQHNATINAVVTLNPRAEEDAREIDERIARGEDPGPLGGLPVGIKDVTPVRGLRTTYGSTIYANHVPDQDALVVERLRGAGAVILGKTNCPEFAAGGNTFNEVFGRTRNPWDITKSAGGSTGGGAAALVTGMIALAEGTDLGGSLRIPASFCGIVGLRPSVGLVPTHPTDWTWDTLQVTGPMARTAEDVALMLQTISGPSACSPLTQPTAGRDFVAAVQGGLRRDLRIAYCADPARIGVDSDIERRCRAAAFDLQGSGVRVEEIDLDLSAARWAFLALRGLWFVTQMARHAELFLRFDHLLTPCMAVPPFPVEQNYPEAIAGKTMENYVDWIAPTFVLSLTALPVASVPCGLDPRGLPVGLQIVGRPRGEEAVLRLAAEIEHQQPLSWPSRGDRG